MLANRISMMNMHEYFFLDKSEMETKDFWLNVKGNYIFFIGKLLDKYLDLNVTEYQHLGIPLNCGFFQSILNKIGE